MGISNPNLTVVTFVWCGDHICLGAHYISVEHSTSRKLLSRMLACKMKGKILICKRWFWFDNKMVLIFSAKRYALQSACVCWRLHLCVEISWNEVALQQLYV